MKFLVIILIKEIVLNKELLYNISYNLSQYNKPFYNYLYFYIPIF